MGNKGLLALFVWALLAGTPAFAKLDTGQGIFFPRELARRIEAYSVFPLTWWNFFTYDYHDEKELAAVRATCAHLREEGQGLFALVACGEDLRGFEPLLRDWARDVSIRQPMPSTARLQSSLQDALARASLPLPREILGLLRFDPLTTYRDFQKRLEARSPIHLPRHEGFFVDENARRLLIPVKMAFPPQDAAKTEQALAILNRSCGDADTCARWGFLGAHGATFTNQQRIRSDVRRVSSIGTAILIAGLCLLALLGRWRLLLLTPIVGVAVGFSALVTTYVFGSLHGLTVAFGSSIVGLALDYGFHRALNDQKYVGRSNLFGLLTTVGALMVLMLSAVPLLRQMMLFSAVGIVTAFVLIDIAYRRWRVLQGIQSFAFAPRSGKLGIFFTGLWMVGVAVGATCLHPSFDLAKFNFQTVRDRELTLWLAKAANILPPLFIVDSEGSGEAKLQRAHQAIAQGKDHFRVENAAVFLPPAQTQRANLASWQGSPCDDRGGPLGKVAASVSETQRTFFQPFFRELSCAEAHVQAESPLPAYVRDYESDGKWLTMFFPKTPAETGEVKARYPQATSLREVVEGFPRTLSDELRWMVPLSLLLILILLFIHYRSLAWALLPLIPFFTGVGFAAWIAIVFRLDVSFVTLIGLVMLCGLSVDYGIFATDAARYSSKAVSGAWSAILIAASATLSGFAPLLFCRHQVLVQLGQVLSAGTLGTILGAWWGIPAAARMLTTRNVR